MCRRGRCRLLYHVRLCRQTWSLQFRYWVIRRIVIPIRFRVLLLACRPHLQRCHRLLRRMVFCRSCSESVRMQSRIRCPTNLFFQEMQHPKTSRVFDFWVGASFHPTRGHEQQFLEHIQDQFHCLCKSFCCKGKMRQILLWVGQHRQLHCQVAEDHHLCCSLPWVVAARRRPSLLGAARERTDPLAKEQEMVIGGARDPQKKVRKRLVMPKVVLRSVVRDSHSPTRIASFQQKRSNYRKFWGETLLHNTYVFPRQVVPDPKAQSCCFFDQSSRV